MQTQNVDHIYADRFDEGLFFDLLYTEHLVRDLILVVIVAMALNMIGLTWVNYDIPGTWPTWIGPN